ncbi:hypothetical protein LTR37_002416 [Vermiconidia calcicola]|uniref:Uncharacterized protein n=1 Tax=Vermiconidia calcicola TaxID=1690605 RepID=A0ACC3NT50_9PEZI|nr:hypothetical protein LTR37_002416 [Vermiconidia calcicola]
MGNPQAAKKRKIAHDSNTKFALRQNAVNAPSHGIETVVVRTGPGDYTKTFNVHKDLLTKHSEFFKAALSSEWKEGQERVVRLRELENPEPFKLFVDFLYTGKIFSGKVVDVGTMDHSEANLQEYYLLVKAWTLGEMILSTPFKDGIMDAMISKLVAGEDFPDSWHPWVWKRTTPNSTLRRLLVDIAIWDWEEDTLSEVVKPESGNVELLYDLAVGLTKITQTGRKGSAPYMADSTCIYHEHGEDKACYKA